MKGGILLTIARRELLDAMRSRVLWIVTGLFAVFALGLAFSGGLGGAEGGTGFARASASLLNLVLLLYPLVALFLGIGSLIDERGALDLLLAQPVSRAEVLLGKFLGLGATLVSSTLVGFGLAGLALALKGGGEPGRYVTLTALACALGLAFLALSMAIAVLCAERTRALGVAVAVWFGSVILYDLAVVAGASWIGAKQLSPAFVLLLFLNPVDLARVLGILSLDSAMAFGATGASLMRLMSLPVAAMSMAAGLLAWTALPLAGALVAFRRSDR